jgi:hypothetical protein
MVEAFLTHRHGIVAANFVVTRFIVLGIEVYAHRMSCFQNVSHDH